VKIVTPSDQCRIVVNVAISTLGHAPRFWEPHSFWKFLFFEPFCPRIPTVKGLVGLSHFGQGYQRWKFLLFEHFWSRIPMVEVLVDLGHFWPRFATVKVFVFSWSFLAKVTNDEVLYFWAFLAKVTIQWKFFLAFLARLPTVKVLVILAMVTFTGHFGYEYQSESYICDLRFAFEQPLASCSAKREFAFAGGNLWHPLCKQEFAVQEATPGMELEVWVYSYTSRHVLARKYDYTHTTVGKVLYTNICPINFKGSWSVKHHILQHSCAVTKELVMARKKYKPP